MTTCKETGKEIFLNKKLAVDVIKRQDQRKRIAKKIRTAKSQVVITKRNRIPYKCEFCGGYHISGVNRNKRKQNE